MIKSGVVVAGQFFARSKDIFSYEKKSRFRVLPWHLDLNMHVNNATYFNFCNQARLEYLAASGILRFLVKRKINPIIIKNEISYLRSLKLFDSFTIISKLNSVETKEIVIQHEFFARGKKVALCLSHAKLIGKDVKDYHVILEEFNREKEQSRSA